MTGHYAVVSASDEGAYGAATELATLVRKELQNRPNSELVGGISVSVAWNTLEYKWRFIYAQAILLKE